MTFWFVLLLVLAVVVFPIVVLLGLWTLEDVEVEQITWNDEE